MANRKRSSLLINPKFQLALISYAAVVAGLILGAVYLLFTYGFHEFAQIGQQAGLPPDHVYFQFISMQESTFLRVMGALALLVAIILILGGLVLSHKVAGPIYRMQKDFLSMTEKQPFELKPIQFRKGDFFPELADAFNNLVEKWKQPPKP